MLCLVALQQRHALAYRCAMWRGTFDTQGQSIHSRAMHHGTSTWGLTIWRCRHFFPRRQGFHWNLQCTWETICTSIWLGKEVRWWTSISFFHRRARPPFLPSHEIASMDWKFSSSRIDIISLTVNFVSMRNKIVGAFLLTKSTSTWTAGCFPSPRQFQLITIIGLSETAL